MWYFSKACNCLPFFPVFIMSTLSAMVPYACPVFSMWFDYWNCCFFFGGGGVACMSSLYLMLNVLPVCPIYSSGQSSKCHFCCIYLFVNGSLICFVLCFVCRKLSNLLTYGVEPFLRSCQLCSHSKTSQHFVEPEGSSPCSQEPSTGPYPEPDRSSPYHPICIALRSCRKLLSTEKFCVFSHFCAAGCKGDHLVFWCVESSYLFCFCGTVFFMWMVLHWLLCRMFFVVFCFFCFFSYCIGV
jgi:hypothetical protein